jgi:hypothetical protein
LHGLRHAFTSCAPVNVPCRTTRPSLTTRDPASLSHPDRDRSCRRHPPPPGSPARPPDARSPSRATASNRTAASRFARTLREPTFANPAPHGGPRGPRSTRSPSRACEWPCLRGFAGADPGPGDKSDRLRGVGQALSPRTRARVGVRTAGRPRNPAGVSPTPHGDAVTFGYGAVACSDTDFQPC